MIYFCCDDRRRNAIAAHPTLNGIDFLEVTDMAAGTLAVHFIKDLAPDALAVENVQLEGGERIRQIKITKVTVAPAGDNKVLAVEVDKAGDFSTYTLRIFKQDHADEPPDGFDPILSAIDFSFKVACASEFDCRTEQVCPPEPLVQPEINYLAKDYASFRQLMLDRMTLVAPEWRERNAADIGIALVEVLAYVGDYLSYQQDSIATESYLGTARRRISVRRHARLVDYHMHDGANARAWVQVQVSNDMQLARGTQIFSKLSGLPIVIAPNSHLYDEALSARPVIFETMHEAKLFAAHNEIAFYTWGDERCCLPQGATSASLNNEGGRLDKLKAGDVLVFTEARNPQNGNTAEANPAHRHAVRLTNIKATTDPLFTEANSNQALRVLNIEWAADDALPFPLCVWSVAVDNDANNKQPSSIALGNIVLADHGFTITNEPLGVVPEANPVLDKIRPGAKDTCAEPQPKPTPPRFQPQLRGRPVTHAAPYDPQQPPASAYAVMHGAAGEFLPAIKLQGDLNGSKSDWFPQRDLLSSESESREFVVETESDGTSVVRFGDDLFGLRPASGTSFTAEYRVGNGPRGNVGAGALGHVIGVDPSITAVSNPLSAHGGIAPESIEQVRQNAPFAFRTQERAVTPDDYAEVAERHAGVQRAAATVRWTGSWRTIFLTIDRLGGADVDEDFRQELRQHLDRYRMAGQDVEIEGPLYVSLEIEMIVCVAPHYFRSDVQKELLALFSSRVLADGRRGVFHPDNFTFGQTVYLSRLYAAAQTVEGVASVEIRTFQRQGKPATSALQTGALALGRLEIARLDNDPNFPERGVFRLQMKGGR